MKNSAVALVLAGMLTCLLAPGLAGAQMDSRSFGKPIEAAPVDPRIQAAIQQISPERIEQDISTLVSFHNRSTLSSNEKTCPRDKACWQRPIGSRLNSALTLRLAADAWR